MDEEGGEGQVVQRFKRYLRGETRQFNTARGERRKSAEVTHARENKGRKSGERTPGVSDARVLRMSATMRP